MKTAVNRLYQTYQHKLDKIARLKLEKEKAELALIKPRPDISPNSRKITENKKIKPLYERTPEVIRTKEEKMNKARMEAEEKRREAEEKEMFRPNIKASNKGYDRVRNISEMTRDFHIWQTHKVAQHQHMQYENIVKEMEGLTFRPTISNWSKRIAEKVTRIIL